MTITFDPKKDRANVSKHGVSLHLALEFEWTSAVVLADLRREYGKERMVGIGYIGNRLFVVVYSDRPEGRRIISLRKANQREIQRYAKT